MIRLFLLGLVFLFVPFGQATTAPPAGTITIDAMKSGAAIPANLYGIFFEEISHAGDGGLYAELIQNRGFEDSRLPPMSTLENGFVVPERTPHFDTGKPSDWRLRWTVTSETPGWTLDTPKGARGSMRLVDVEPFNKASTHSLEVNIEDLGERIGGRVALLNEGYWGINVVKGEEYDLSFYARDDGQFSGQISAVLESADGIPLAQGRSVRDPSTTWTKYGFTLQATGSDPKARLALSFGATGRVWIDFVSLFPKKTWKNRPNGLRPDIAQLIADLKPGFVRWPGGCFAEGINIQSRPQWKRSIGRLEDREGTYSPWGYWSTDGFGYHEFLQFSEDLGAAALFVINVGVSCSMRSGTFIEDDQLPALIQDALEGIEYAIGPPTSQWGAVRAKNGHPAPFPLRYIEIGNEQRGERYGQRVALFYKAIKEKYPQLKIALSSWIAGVDRRIIDAAGTIDIVDEHAYKPLHWAIENFDSFASYKREGWDLYIGEFATNAGVGRGNVLAMLNDAAYMMSMEKNSDLVKMGSYAPLLENVNDRDWPVNMIHFDSSRVYARATYYANKLFAENLPSVNLVTAVDYRPATPKPITARVGVATHNTAAEFKDVVIERDGQRIFASDFSTTSGWTPEGRRGRWSAVEGAYRQDEQAIAWSFISDAAAAGAADFTVSLKARKLSGLEGFIIPVGVADGRRVQWNVGGWGNTRHALQAADAVVGEQVRGSIETGRWYDIRVEVRDRTVRGYLDGQLVEERTLPRVDKVLAIAGRDEKTGDIIVKVVNSAPAAAPMTLTINGMPRVSGGTVTVLTSNDPLDENTFEQPTTVVPKTTRLTVSGRSITQTFAPYSLTVIRLSGR
ncbi:MAG TPA: alpha-L-arabinofuranosidase C-terminal domain-containing protein [Vicinamibacterales bacterium]|nr:alpha-L-arabinofuranosidase C-terminal domain-containing protein [Vicinamibacterales bacterium]